MDGCYRTASTEGSQDQAKANTRWDVERCSPLFFTSFSSSLLRLFRRTRWTPAPGRSRTDTAPADTNALTTFNLQWLNVVNKPKPTCDYCLSLTHRSIHHVRFAVPQGLYCVEDIDHTLSFGHLTDNAAGTEHSTTPTSVSVLGPRHKILTEKWDKMLKLIFHLQFWPLWYCWQTVQVVIKFWESLWGKSFTVFKTTKWGKDMKTNYHSSSIY